MENISHSPDKVKSHPLYVKHGKQLSEIANKDYPRAGYFSKEDIPGIDLDEYEKSLQTGYADCTADTVIGIAELKGDQLTNHQLLLVEFRMAYINADNLSYTTLEEKYRHSKDLLIHTAPDDKVSPRFALIFKTEVASQAKSKISRWRLESNKKASKNWDVYNDRSFCQSIRYGEEVPALVSPILEATIKRWSSISIDTIDELCTLVEEIKETFYKTYGVGRSVDVSYLRKSIEALFKELSVPEGEDEYYGIIKEELFEEIGIPLFS